MCDRMLEIERYKYPAGPIEYARAKQGRVEAIAPQTLYSHSHSGQVRHDAETAAGGAQEPLRLHEDRQREEVC